MDGIWLISLFIGFDLYECSKHLNKPWTWEVGILGLKMNSRRDVIDIASLLPNILQTGEIWVKFPLDFN